MKCSNKKQMQPTSYYQSECYTIPFEKIQGIRKRIQKRKQNNTFHVLT